MNEYKLKTLEDVVRKIPIDRIEDCMKELTVMFLQVKPLIDLTDILGGEAGVRVPEFFNWIDDGTGEVHSNIHSGGTHIMTIKDSIDKQE